MSKRPWMAWYPEDHRGRTAKLNRAQDGSYRRLIDEYWISGGLPNDEAQLAQIAGMTPKEWKTERELMAGFFGPEWSHKRIDAELEKFAELSKKRSESVRNRKFRPVDSNVVPFKGAEK